MNSMGVKDVRWRAEVAQSAFLKCKVPAQGLLEGIKFRNAGASTRLYFSRKTIEQRYQFLMLGVDLDMPRIETSIPSY